MAKAFLFALCAMGLVACGGGGGGPIIRRDGGADGGAGGPDGPAPRDMTSSSPDLARPPGTLTCIQTINCYFDMMCDQQSCFDACGAKSKTASYAMHAEEYFSCFNTAYSGVCMNACSQSTDAGIAMCRACIQGMCTQGSGGVVTCTGGQCSSSAAACFNDN